MLNKHFYYIRCALIRLPRAILWKLIVVECELSSLAVDVVMHTTLLLLFPLILRAAAGPVDELVIQPRVFKGQKAKIPAEGIFAVQINYDKQLVCTGSLLSERHILTAAHCFDRTEYEGGESLYVVAGETKPKKLNYFQAKNKIYQLHIHPDYDKYAFVADIAVASVRIPIRTGRIRFAKLCTQPLVADDEATVFGYGTNENLSADNPLLYATMPVIGLDECSNLLEQQLPPNVICTAGYKQRQTVCRGDSGGPLVHNDEVCGINTWTYECGNSIKPDIFMSVFYYKDFIEKTMNETRY